MVTPGYEPINHCDEDGMFGGWSDDPAEISCQKNYCTFPKPESEGIWFFGCTDEKNQNMGIITEGKKEIRFVFFYFCKAEAASSAADPVMKESLLN